MKRRHISVLAVFAILVGVVGFLITRTPETRRVQDTAGRTWVPIAGTDGSDLILVNGFSGLIEARAFDGDGGRIPAGLRRQGSNGDVAVLRGDDAVSVVDTGTNLVHSRDLADVAVLAGRDLLVLDQQPYLTGALTEGTERPVVGAPAPGPAPSPVTDADGTAWYLSAGPEVEAVGVSDDGEWSSRSVAAETTTLHVVDGNVFAREPGGLRKLQSGPELRLDGERSIVPVVAEATDGLWAWGEGDTVTIDGEKPTRVPMDAAVTSLALWHGAVVVATEDGAAVIEDGKADPIQGLAGSAELFVDGGILWARGPERLVAVWPDLQRVVIRIVTSNLDLCIDTCSPEDARQREPDRNPPGTTQPPRELDPPPVQPTLSESTTTTTPFATSTVPPTTVPDPPTTVVTTTSSVPPTTDVPPPTPPPGPGPPTPPLDPEPPRPTDPPTPTDPPPTLPPVVETTTTTTTTSPPDPDRPGLILTVTPGQASAEITVGVQGRRETCGVFGGTAEVAWSGVTSGSRLIRLRWDRGAEASRLETLTVDRLEAGGTLTVTLKACGLSTVRSAEVRSTVPSVGQISFTPPSPSVGTQVTVGVAMSEPDPWALSSTSWAIGRCGSEAAVGDTSPRRSEVFTPTEPGRYCVQVVATFTSPDDTTTLEGRGDVNVADTTTTTAPTTTAAPTTTVPATTTTFAPTTTAAPTTTVPPTTTTAPPPTTTEPPATTSPTTTGP